MGHSRFISKIVSAIDSSLDYPDIIRAGHTDRYIGKGVNVSPVNRCLELYNFDQIPDYFWGPVTIEDAIWGIPIEYDALVLYYNKNLLRDLGWSEDRLDALPKDIAKGKFTLNDLMAEGEKAIGNNIVESGFAFIPYRSSEGATLDVFIASGGEFPQNATDTLVYNKSAMQVATEFESELFDRKLVHSIWLSGRQFSRSSSSLWYDMISTDRALFWQANYSLYPRLERLFDKSRDQDVDDVIGRAPFPSNLSNGQGKSRLYMNSYMITIDPSEEPDKFALACRYLFELIQSDFSETILSNEAFLTPLPNDQSDQFSEFLYPENLWHLYIWDSDQTIIYNRESYVNWYIEQAYRVTSQDIDSEVAADLIGRRLHEEFPDLIEIE